jgi:AcrR family transcriptional regulator
MRYAKPVAQLAENFTDRGLPRGRGSLPPQQVAHAQRQRMLRAIVAAAAEQGYANVRINDVADRARVSKQSFYAQFQDKEQCFLAAHQQGVELIVAQLAQWATANGDHDPRAALRRGIRAYLQMAAEEPDFTRCMLIDLPATGPAGLEARDAVHEQIAELYRAWHTQALQTNPSWPTVPESRYAAAVGAVHDLLFSTVATGQPANATALEDDAVDAVTTLLQIPVEN